MNRNFGILLILFLTVLTGYSQSPDQEWTVFRGRPDLTGNTNIEVPSSPSLIWSLSTLNRTKSSPVVSGGLIFFGNEKGSVIATGTDGKIRWQYEGGVAAEAPPLISGDMVIIGFNDGTLHAISRNTGNTPWK